MKQERLDSLSLLMIEADMLRKINFDDIIKDFGRYHIATIKAKKAAVSCFSPQVQNKIITLVGEKVKGEILSRIIINAKYYSLLFDCTPDVSHKERLSEVIRYVLIKNGMCSIEEIHTLNLVGVHAAEVSPLMVTFFGSIQKIFTFFSNSTSRWENLIKELLILLKGHCETRWSSKKEAVAFLNNQLVKVYSVLQNMSTKPTLNHETVVGEKELLKLFNLKFLCLLNLWTKILTLIDRENHAMQAKKI
ncbi:uncharacterized protein LOC136074582 [Hydra vulgaris]|uniref:Uncharacterized protein LOC136074582 n=1 Tax=Hydra vulgaris TaxID=6087 RepID=A0ABM4B2E7_HYDVU